MIFVPTFRDFLTPHFPVATAGTSSGAAWSAQVVSNGGSAIGTANQTAVTTFISGLDTDSLTSKMLCCVFFESSSLIAATTPFYFNGGSGSQPWTNANFVAGDLTVAGLIGNGTSKRLDTGILFGNNSSIIGTSSFGVSIMYPVNPINGPYDSDFGFQPPTPTSKYLGIYFNGAQSGNNAFICDCWTYTLTPARFIAQNNWTNNYIGFGSYNRTSATAERADFGSTARGYSTLKTQTGEGSISIPPTGSLTAYSQGNTAYSSKRYSFVAVHAGLSATETQNLYNRVQTLRTSFGGGTV